MLAGDHCHPPALSHDRLVESSCGSGVEGGLQAGLAALRVTHDRHLQGHLARQSPQCYLVPVVEERLSYDLGRLEIEGQRSVVPIYPAGVPELYKYGHFYHPAFAWQTGPIPTSLDSSLVSVRPHTPQTPSSTP